MYDEILTCTCDTRYFVAQHTHLFTFDCTLRPYVFISFDVTVLLFFFIQRGGFSNFDEFKLIQVLSLRMHFYINVYIWIAIALVFILIFIFKCICVHIH